MTAGVGWVRYNSPFKMLSRFEGALTSRVDDALPPQPVLIGSQDFRRLVPRLSERHFLKLNCHRSGYAARDLVLDGEDVGEFTVIALGPDMMAADSLDQLSRDADAFVRSSDASLKDKFHAQFPSDAANVGVLSLVGYG